MRSFSPLGFCSAIALLASSASATEPVVSEGAREVGAASLRADGDLFPGAGRPTAAAATGLPFLGIAELGMGLTRGFAIGVVGGITPSVVTAGLRPRLRIPTGERTAIVVVAPMLYYPRASAPGPGNVGTSSWVLTRPEIYFDGALGDRWHVAGGMGVVAAASTEAIAQLAQGNDFTMPPYDGSTETRRGFAGGLWNTVSGRASYALAPGSHLFAESTLVMKGVVPADGVGGPPIVVTVGAQHTF